MSKKSRQYVFYVIMSFFSTRYYVLKLLAVQTELPLEL